MIRHDADVAANYLMDSEIFGKKRIPTSPFDYGDGATVGLNLKRSRYGYELGTGDGDDSFGIYLGKHPEGYVVAVKKLDYSGFSACEVFSTIGDLHAEWQLD